MHRLNAQVQATDGLTLDQQAGRAAVACALLVNDRCGVYSVRPLTCRGFNSMNVEQCRADFERAESNIPTFALQYDVGVGCIKGVMGGLAALDLQPSTIHLAPALLAVLREPDLPERWLAGEPVFRAFEDRRLSA
jgi:hypothetical protein